VSLAGLGPVEVEVGSIQEQTTNFDQFKEIDGVMGFTEGTKKNVFASLVAAGKSDNVWAMCMAPGSKSNGTLTIGGVDPRLSVGGNVTYVPDSCTGFHCVSVHSIEIGGKAAAGSAAGAGAASIPVGKSGILDTGTNVLLLGTQTLAAVHKSVCSDSGLAQCEALFGSGAKGDVGQCVALTEAQVDAYPGLTLVLDNGLELEMSSRDYLLLGSPLATAAGQYCLGLRDGGNAGGSGFIIGDTTMRNYCECMHLHLVRPVAVAFFTVLPPHRPRLRPRAQADRMGPGRQGQLRVHLGGAALASQRSIYLGNKGPLCLWCDLGVYVHTSML
jgi:hypothetical protein